MVDAVDLFFIQHLADLFVERARGIVIAAERFFDDHPPPAAVFFHQARRTQLFDHHREEAGRGCQIIEVIAARAMVFVHLGQKLVQFLVNLGVVEIAGDVVNAACEPVPQIGVDLGGGEVADFLADHVSELLAAHFVPGNPDHGEFLGKQIVLRQIVKRGNEFALGEIAGCAKNHHDARIAGAAGAGAGYCHNSFVCHLHALSSPSLTWRTPQACRVHTRVNALNSSKHGVRKSANTARKCACGTNRRRPVPRGPRICCASLTAFFPQKYVPDASGSA